MSSGASAGVTERGAEVVCDAGPLIHLDELGCLDLLGGFSAVLVPEQVQREVERHRPTAVEQRTVEIRLHAVELSTAPPFKALVRSLGLALGEQAALSLSMQHTRALLLTDDASARIAAHALGIRAQGTVGVLVRAIRWEQRSRDEILDVLKRIPTDSTLHIRPSLLDEVIRRVESS